MTNYNQDALYLTKEKYGRYSAKLRKCMECGNLATRSQVRYKRTRSKYYSNVNTRIEHYICTNQLCLAKIRITIETHILENKEIEE